MVRKGGEYGPAHPTYQEKSVAIARLSMHHVADGDEPIGQALLDLGRAGAEHPGFSHRQQDMLRAALRQSGVFTYQDELDQKDPEFVEKEMDQVRWALEMDPDVQFQATITLARLMQKDLSGIGQLELLQSLMNIGHKKGMEQVDMIHADDPTFGKALACLDQHEGQIYEDLNFRAGVLQTFGVLSQADIVRIDEIEYLGEFQADQAYDALMLRKFLRKSTVDVDPLMYFGDLQDVLYLGAAIGVRDGKRAIKREDELYR